MASTSVATSTTAEVFMAEIVHLIRSHQIHTVELVSATEVQHGKRAAVSHLLPPPPPPIIILVEARLSSALTWQHNACSTVAVKKKTKKKWGSGSSGGSGGGGGGDPDGGSFQEGGSTFTRHISFLLSNAASTSTVTISEAEGAGVNAGPFFPPTSPQTVLSAWWCAQLQRRLAICSALTGLPTSLNISLLPYVPQLRWDRGRDGILGAMHCATMKSTVTDRDSTSEGADLAGHVVQVAMLLNANIPLGPRAGRKTAVLLLHAVDGDVCVASASSPPTIMPREERKRPRQWLREEGQHSTEVVREYGLLFPLLLRFTQKHLLPMLSWAVVGSRPVPNDTGNDDVCGLWEQLGCSFYLEGTLDARSVQSITVIFDAPHELWRRMVEYDASVELRGDKALQGLLRCITETAEGVLSRLVAENVDCFVHRVPLAGSEEGEMEERCLGSGADGTVKSTRQSWMLLVQCIADSLAQIVRTSRNRAFVAEVHRLLRLHQEEAAASFSASERNDLDNADDDAAAAATVTPSFVGKTASQLRWAVEARLLEG